MGSWQGDSPDAWMSKRGRGRALGLLSPTASLVYRLPQSWVGPRLPWKSGHAAMHLLAFLLTVLGLHAVFEFHNHAKIPHLYSLHSWLGITTVFLFACQVGTLSSLGSRWLPTPAGASLASAPNLPSAQCLETVWQGACCRIGSWRGSGRLVVLPFTLFHSHPSHHPLWSWSALS